MVNWSDIGKTVGNIAGSLVGGLNFGSTGGTSLNQSKILAQHQFNLSKKYTQWLNEQGYSQMRTGLEKAGYNPLLAVGATPQNGMQSMPVATTGSAQGFSGQDAINALVSMANVANLKADTDGKLLGKLSQFIGTKYAGKVSGIVDNLLDSIQNTAKSNEKIEEAGKGVLKGYISNSSKFDYVPELEEMSKLPPELSQYK